MILVPQPPKVSLADSMRASVADAQTKVRLDRASEHAQGYRLSITRDGVSIVAHDEAGAFYAKQTLAQIRR